jgi:hypothetical protein
MVGQHLSRSWWPSQSQWVLDGIAYTGCTVMCGGLDIMRKLRIPSSVPVSSDITLRTADGKPTSPATCGCPTRSAAPDPLGPSQHVWPPTQVLHQAWCCPPCYLHPCSGLSPLQEEVKKQLARDMELGILEKMPSNEHTVWQHRMVVIRKQNGSPRRIVHMQKLNNASLRQTHSFMSPYHIRPW